MKRRFICVFLVLCMLFSLCGCSRQWQEDPDKLQVVCSLFPYYDFVRVIGGEFVEPYLLVAAGREAHSFEPTPLDVIRISKADIFVYNGGEGEQWVDALLDSAGDSIGSVLRMMDYADTVEEEAVDGMQVSEEPEEDSDEIAYDEHIWTSPIQAMKLCRAICDCLCAFDSVHAEAYRQNLAAYLSQLTQLDEDFRQVAMQRKRDLLVFGDRFPMLYFCREYGLSYRAAFHGCSGDTEPSLYTLKYLIDRVEQENIPVVYTLELSSQKVANAIAETTGAKVLTFYSCQTISPADYKAGECYLSLMQKNVIALREGIC